MPMVVVVHRVTVLKPNYNLRLCDPSASPPTRHVWAVGGVEHGVVSSSSPAYIIFF